MRPARPRSPAAACCTATLAALIVGPCDGPTGPLSEACGAPPYFTVLPVAPEDIDGITVVGGLGAPTHTLPTAHAGMYLARAGVPVRAPGAMAVTGLRRTTYVVSPNRQGEQDYAVEFRVCREVTGWFGHLTALASTIPTDQLAWTGCQTYSTADETVEACSANPRDLVLEAGADLGTGGLSAALGLGLDFGLLDSRVRHFYAAPHRYPENTFHAVCPWERFDAGSQALLFAKLRDLSRPAVVPAGEPRCGTMAVDGLGTAKGVWAEADVTGPVAGDERRYITLADYPYRPQDELALSLGPQDLGAAVAVVPRQPTGRVNRAFEEVTADGVVYCYAPVAPGAVASWLLALTASEALMIERVSHGAGASPCGAPPTTWSFGGGAVRMVR